MWLLENVRNLNLGFARCSVVVGLATGWDGQVLLLVEFEKQLG